MLALMLGSLLLWGVSKRRRRGGVGLGFGADVGQPLGAAAHKLLRVTSASDDGTAASAGGSVTAALRQAVRTSRLALICERPRLSQR